MGMMAREHRQEALSVAYVKAVAAVCGMTHGVSSHDYGIDITLNEIAAANGRLFESGTHLEIQAKSTTVAVESRAAVGYDLDIRAYDALRQVTPLPRILALLVLPPDESEWVRQTRQKLEIRGRMYWASLRGLPGVANRRAVRVQIPRRQVFTTDGLLAIIERVKQRRDL